MPNKKYLYHLASLICIPLLLGCIGFLIYSNSFYASFHFDDSFTIIDNRFIKDLNNLKALWTFDPSRFLTHLTFALNYHYDYLDVEGYHLINVALHILNTWCVYVLCLFIFSTFQRKQLVDERHIKRLSVFSALMFLCHPLQTQAVTYISQRSTLLATLFYLIAVIGYMHYRLRGNRLFCLAALGSAFLGVFTKPIMISLPLAIFIVELIFKEEFLKSRWPRILYVLPFGFIAALVPVLLILWRFKTFNLDVFGGVTMETARITRGEYLLTQFNVLRTYARLLFFPVNQNLDYDYPIAETLWTVPTFLSFCFVLSVIAAAVWTFRRQLVVSLGLWWMIITLVLESSFFPINDVINEHRLYLPMVGFAIGIAYVITSLLKEKRKFFLCSGLIVVLLAGMTYERNKVWNSQLVMLKDIVSKSPDKARMWNNLGNQYYYQKDYEKAREIFLKVIELDPAFPHVYINLSNVYDELGMQDQAIKALETSIDLIPGYPGSYFNIGLIHWKDGKGDPEKAGHFFVKAIEADPNYAPAWDMLGEMQKKYKNYSQAKFYFQYAMQKDPGYGLSYAHMGDVFKNQGDYARAEIWYNEAILRLPDDPAVINNRGVILYKQAKFAKAEEDFYNVLKYDPTYALAYLNLGELYAQLGEYEKAGPMYDQAAYYFERQGKLEKVMAVREARERAMGGK